MRGGVLLLLGLLPGCTYFTGDSHVIVTSDPPGAQIFLDGSNTGYTTPAALDLGGFAASDRTITLRKEGYEDESRHLYHYTSGYSSRFIDAATEVELWNNPVYWTIGDFLLPFGIKWRFVPHELYVTLYAEGQAPVRVDPEAPEEK